LRFGFRSFVSAFGSVPGWFVTLVRSRSFTRFTVVRYVLFPRYCSVRLFHVWFVRSFGLVAFVRCYVYPRLFVPLLFRLFVWVCSFGSFVLRLVRSFVPFSLFGSFHLLLRSFVDFFAGLFVRFVYHRFRCVTLFVLRCVRSCFRGCSPHVPVVRFVRLRVGLFPVRFVWFVRLGSGCFPFYFVHRLRSVRSVLVRLRLLVRSFVSVGWFYVCVTLFTFVAVGLVRFWFGWFGSFVRLLPFVCCVVGYVVRFVCVRCSLRLFVLPSWFLLRLFGSFVCSRFRCLLLRCLFVVDRLLGSICCFTVVPTLAFVGCCLRLRCCSLRFWVRVYSFVLPFVPFVSLLRFCVFVVRSLVVDSVRSFGLRSFVRSLFDLCYCVPLRCVYITLLLLLFG
jgi:hypothetical protein